MRMAGLRVWVMVLAMLAAGAVRAECELPDPAQQYRFHTPSDDVLEIDFEYYSGSPDTVGYADLAWKRPGHPAARQAGECKAAILEIVAKNRSYSEAPGSEIQAALMLSQDALQYLKVRSFATDDQRAVIEPWLIQLADRAAASAKRNGVPKYWLGLALGAVGMATGSERHWEAARLIAEQAALDVRADGALPLAFTFRNWAQKVHVFALMPLVTLASLARAQGEDFYAFGDGAIDRLAGLVAKGIADPGVFKELAGIEQSPTKPGAGWSQLYALHAPDAAGAKIGMPRNYPAFGGDVQMLVRALGASEQE